MLNQIYRKYFYAYINYYLKIKDFDNKIESSNLYFGISNKLSNTCMENFNTKFIRCLNKFYTDKLSDEYKKILLDKSIGDNEKFNVIKETLVDVISKDDAKTITYGFAEKNRIVENGTIVLEIVYGKNTEVLNEDLFIENLEKQRNFIDNLIKEIEELSIKNLGIKCRVLIFREL